VFTANSIVTVRSFGTHYRKEFLVPMQDGVGTRVVEPTAPTIRNL